MRTAPLPRSIREALPDPLGSDYAPDGLSGDLDALIDAAYGAVAGVQYRPGWMNPDPVEQRRARRLARQVVRSLPTTLIPVSAAGCTECGATVCDDCWTPDLDNSPAGEAA